MRVDDQRLVQALRGLPVPEPRLGFVDSAIENAVRKPARRSLTLHLFSSWETWLGVAAGAAAATLLSLSLPRSLVSTDTAPIALSINEVRNIDVVIDSERDLAKAKIHVALIGGLELEGFAQQRQLDWTADLHRGANLLSLPLLARSSGNGVLIAMIEHDGGQRSITLNVRVRDSEPSRS